MYVQPEWSIRHFRMFQLKTLQMYKSINTFLYSARSFKRFNAYIMYT